MKTTTFLCYSIRGFATVSIIGTTQPTRKEKGQKGEVGLTAYAAKGLLEPMDVVSVSKIENYIVAARTRRGYISGAKGSHELRIQ